MEYSLVGFGGKPRFCLGYAFAQMEMKIFASLLLHNYIYVEILQYMGNIAKSKSDP